MYLDSLHEQVFLDAFDSERLDFGEATVVTFNFSAYLLERNNSCLFRNLFSYWISSARQDQGVLDFVEPRNWYASGYRWPIAYRE